MKGLRSILGDSVKQAGGTRRAEEQACIGLWAETMGEGIAEATRAEKFRDGILFVITKSSVWTHELTFYKENAIRLLNERLGRELIRDIRFRVGSLEPPKVKLVRPETERTERVPSPEPMETMLTERARAQVEQALAAIQNEQIRERTRRVLVREAHRREQKKRQGWRECERCGTLHPESHRMCPLCRLHIRT
ncbi:MAG: DUF721 domain-containing protein [Armatimonadetes bacterium]|nr:DUF721 domain-containing protein [Armatimonadota bacterium]